MLGSGSAGNSALVATDHCKILIDGGLSARQIVLRLEQCGVMPEQLDGILLTHEHGDHVCGLEVLCRKLDLPIYANAQTAEVVRYDGVLDRHRNSRIFRTGAEFAICDVLVQTFPCPHDALELQTVRNSLNKLGKIEIELFCATQSEISPRFCIGETALGAFQPTFENAFFPAA